MKVGLVPVNTNYRYGDDELAYLWDNADAVAVVFHGAFAERIERILDRVPAVKGWLWVDDGSGPCPDWATPYEDAAKSAVGRVARAVGAQRRRPLHALHRRHHRDAQGRHVAPGRPLRPAHRRRCRATTTSTAARRRRPAPGEPGRHGADARLPAHARDRRLHGQHDASPRGAESCLLGPRSYDPVELLDTIQSERVNGLVIVGDPFSRPILAALDEHPGEAGT